MNAAINFTPIRLPNGFTNVKCVVLHYGIRRDFRLIGYIPSKDGCLSHTKLVMSTDDTYARERTIVKLEQQVLMWGLGGTDADVSMFKDGLPSWVETTEHRYINGKQLFVETNAGLLQILGLV
jgi:hypothetical protein